jgi:uncharacterized phage-associated protein
MSKRLKALDFAHWFINRADRESGEAITHLKVQKLLYFAEAYHLANFNRSLFREEFEAWAHGPVVQEVWRDLKSYGWDAIPLIDTQNKIKEPIIVRYLESLYDKFGRMGAKRLEEMTHEHLPWKNARGNLPPEASSSARIDKTIIRDFYAGRINKRWGKPIGA